MRLIDLNTDYFTLCEWWTKHGHVTVPRELLPKTGFIIEDKAACFLYKTDSALAYTNWLVSNPECSAYVAGKACQDLLNACTREAKRSGYNSIFSMASKPSVVKLAEKVGYSSKEPITALWLNINK